MLQINKDGSLTVKANGELSKFAKLLVDRKEVAEKDYTIVSGSTIATLNKEFLDELSEGTHELTFTMKTATNETIDTKYASADKVEGILINRIPKVGLIIWYSQKPWIILTVIAIILLIGAIAYYFAQKLDKRDMQILEEERLIEEKLETKE